MAALPTHLNLNRSAHWQAAAVLSPQCLQVAAAAATHGPAVPLAVGVDLPVGARLLFGGTQLRRRRAAWNRASLSAKQSGLSGVRR